MSNVSTSQFVPMNTDYAQHHQPAAQVNKPRELSQSAESVNKFLKDTAPVSKEHNVTVNKESLEKLFAMFEFAVKAMRSMLAGMGVLPKLPGELDAQPPVKPGPDLKVVPDTTMQNKVAPQADTKTKVMPGPDAKAAGDTSVKPKVELQADAKTQVRPGPEVKVMPDGQTQVTIAPDGKLSTQPTTPSLADAAQKNKLSADINVTVQVQGCHCPHTGEKVTPQPGLSPKVDKQPLPLPLPQPSVTPNLDKQPAPQPAVTPKLDTSPSPQPQVTPMTVNKPQPKPPVKPDAPTPATVDPKPDTRPTPDLTSPAPDDLVDDFSLHSRSRFDDHRAARSTLRPRF